LPQLAPYKTDFAKLKTETSKKFYPHKTPSIAIKTSTLVVKEEVLQEFMISQENMVFYHQLAQIKSIPPVMKMNTVTLKNTPTVKDIKLLNTVLLQMKKE